jgi:hypothetical protein
MSDPPSLDQIAVGALILATLSGSYALLCIGWPFARCRRCHGSGDLRAPVGRGLRLCQRCNATGRRLRLGRRLWNHSQRLRHDGTRPDRKEGRQ